MQQAVQGRGGVLVVEGQAGIGKTRLMATLRLRALESGLTVLSARGAELEREIPFGTARQLFEVQLKGCSPQEQATLLSGSADLAAIALGLVGSTTTMPSDPLAVVHALYWLSANIADHGPIVLMVDDAHWSDVQSLRWLHFLGGRIEDLAMLVILSRRSGELTSGSELMSTIADLSGVEVSSLAPLSDDAVATLVRDALGEAADNVFCASCFRASGGNPFFLRELLATVSAQNIMPSSESADKIAGLASAAVGRSVLARVRRLGDSATRLVRAAAVIGPAGRLHHAAALAGIDDTEAVVQSDRLCEAGILGPDAVLDFVHPLVLASVYNDIPPAAKSAAHGQAARWLAAADASPDMVAMHLLATQPQSDEWVVGQLRAAAGQALAAGAPEAAATYLQRASQEPPTPQLRAQVLYELGLATVVVDPHRAIPRLLAARERATASELRTTIALSLAKTLAHADRVADSVTLLDQAITETENPELRRRLQAEQLLWAAFWADDDNRQARSGQLHEMVTHLTWNNLTDRSLLGLRAWDATWRGAPAEQALAAAEATIQPALPFTDTDWGFEIPILVSLVFMYYDKLNRAWELLDAGIEQITNAGWRGTHLAFTYAHRANTEFRQGALLDAETDAYTSWNLTSHIAPDLPSSWYALGTLVEVLIARGQITRAVQLVERHGLGVQRPNAVVMPVPQFVRGELLLAAGRTQDAVDTLRAAGRWLDERGFTNPSWCPWRMSLASALAFQEPDEARVLANEALAQARQAGGAWAIGQALRAVGLAEGGDSGIDLLRTSVRVLESSSARYELARSLVELGAALRRSNRRVDARAPLRQGLDLADRCGANALVQRARQELQATGARPRGTRLTGVTALTPSELRVARLAASGLSNVEIAQRLFVTSKAVEKHLSGAYAKLQIKSRRELAQALATE